MRLRYQFVEIGDCESRERKLEERETAGSYTDTHTHARALNYTNVRDSLRARIHIHSFLLSLSYFQPRPNYRLFLSFSIPLLKLIKTDRENVCSWPASDPPTISRKLLPLCVAWNRDNSSNTGYHSMEWN